MLTKLIRSRRACEQVQGERLSYSPSHLLSQSPNHDSAALLEDNKMERVVILSGVRTPIGAFGGSMKAVPVYELGALVLNEAIKRSGLQPAQVEEVVMGQSYQNGECANAARFAILAAGWPETVPAITIDRRCCSGVDSVIFAALKIQTGNARVVVAGGLESMSQAELYLPGDIRWGLGGRMDQKWGFMPTGPRSASDVGGPVFRPHSARPRDVSADRTLRRAQFDDDVG